LRVKEKHIRSFGVMMKDGQLHGEMGGKKKKKTMGVSSGIMVVVSS
jgi:hypothetical protein